MYNILYICLKPNKCCILKIIIFLNNIPLSNSSISFSLTEWSSYKASIMESFIVYFMFYFFFLKPSIGMVLFILYSIFYILFFCILLFQSLISMLDVY